MSSNTLHAQDALPAGAAAGVIALGVVITLYGSLILIDVLAATLGFDSVPFDVGPPMPRNWFPNFLVGLSIAGSGAIAITGARKNVPWAAVLGLVLALGAVYEIVLLDRVYAYEGRPALSRTGLPTATLQDRLDRIYSGTLGFQSPPR